MQLQLFVLLLAAGASSLSASHSDANAPAGIHYTGPLTSIHEWVDLYKIAYKLPVTKLYVKCGEIPERILLPVEASREEEQVYRTINRIRLNNFKQSETDFCRHDKPLSEAQMKKKGGTMLKEFKKRAIVHLAHVHLMSAHQGMFKGEVWLDLYGVLIDRLYDTMMGAFYVMQIEGGKHTGVPQLAKVTSKYASDFLATPKEIPSPKPVPELDVVGISKEKTETKKWWWWRRRVMGSYWMYKVSRSLKKARLEMTDESLRAEFLKYVGSHKAVRFGYYVLETLMSEYEAKTVEAEQKK